ncbi:MAG: cyclic nucleotide-binding domain-containing protein [Gammaproteobacteria bacterium]
MKTVSQFVREHTLFNGMPSEQVDFIAGCGQLRRFAKGDYLAQENDAAEFFYLIIEGRVVIETHQLHGSATPLLTVNANELVNWSWLIPPYRHRFDARALTALRTVALNGTCIRKKCDIDPKLGFDLLRRLSAVIISSLHNAQFQLLDVYSTHS